MPVTKYMPNPQEHFPSLLVMYLTTSSSKSATSDAILCLVFNSRLSWHVLYFLVLLLVIFLWASINFSAGLLYLYVAWWVTKVKVILWLLRPCCEAPGIISCQSASSVQCRTMKKTVFFNHEITWSQKGGVLSHCVVNNEETACFYIQAAEEIFREMISFPTD